MLLRLDRTETLAARLAPVTRDLQIAEQVILARNDDQHGATLDTWKVHHRWLEAGDKPFFIDARETSLLDGLDDSARAWLGPPSPKLYVSRETLFRAADQIELLAQWLDDEIYARRRAAAPVRILGHIRTRVQEPFGADDLATDDRPNAIIRPRRSEIGNMTRPRKRS